MLGNWSFHGHAIVSADDRIADASGEMPEGLRNETDWRRFQSALDACVLIALGRLSHVARPNLRRRRRLVLSSSADGIEQRADGWWWNPAKAGLEEALSAAAPEGGAVGVPGGRVVFDTFLAAGYDSFDLARATRVRLPGGVPVFSACSKGISAEAVLLRAGLQRVSAETLDAKAGVTVGVWRVTSSPPSP